MVGRIKPIKTSEDYNEAMKLVAELIALDPKVGTEESDQLMVLATLIETYEREHFPVDIPSAVDAIKFRMEQLNLKPADLVPYLGSASRVSEILNGKRTLTVDMINELSNGLGIPEKALLKRDVDNNDFSRSIPTNVFKQMIRRGYFSEVSDKSQTLRKFFDHYAQRPATLFRKSSFNTGAPVNQYMLTAWVSHVIEKANHITTDAIYKDGAINLDFMRQIAQNSVDEENGAHSAIVQLLNRGIKVVIEPALSGLKVDGVTILENKENPIIGLSLRYDRLDNFWFTLMHELAHICKHYNSDVPFIYDTFEDNIRNVSKIEKEANELASEALVDTAKWLVSPARVVPSPITAQALADELGVHITIVAGKARHESGDWSYLASTINKFKIRDKFEEIVW